MDDNFRVLYAGGANSPIQLLAGRRPIVATRSGLQIVEYSSAPSAPPICDIAGESQFRQLWMEWDDALGVGRLQPPATARVGADMDAIDSGYYPEVIH
jgi:hypothetical protein